jgi:UrcA family protein
MKHSLIFAITSCAAFGLLAFSPASAATAERASQRVSFADLNLDGQAGAEVMLHRIRGAADAVCGDNFGRLSLRDFVRIRACSRAAMTKSVTDIANPTLTALYYDQYANRRPNISVHVL